MNFCVKYALFFCALAFSIGVKAEPTSGNVSIKEIRAYAASGTTTSGVVYVQVDSKPLCDTDWFRIDLRYSGAKEMHSVALAALASGKKVKLEIKPKASCEWGHELQSIYIVAG